MWNFLSAPMLLMLSKQGYRQDLTIPSTWKDTMSARTRDQRVHIAQAGLDIVYELHTNDPTNNERGTFPGFPTYDSANMIWTMVLKDRIANTTDNIRVLDAINNFGKQYPEYQDSPSGNWGMAAMIAYLNYRHQDMLAIAQGTWDYVSRFQINEDQAKRGQHPLRNVTFSPTCNKVSVAGAVFTDETPQSLHATAMTVNDFILLSGHLAEQTKNQTYLDAAKLSANFVLQQLYNTTSQLVETDFTIGATDPECKVNLAAIKKPHSSGKYMEALSVLQSCDDDPKWQSLILQLLAGTARHDWSSSPLGVMGDVFAFTDDDRQYKGKFFRSLYEVMLRTSQTDAHDLITAFINVQANSILEYATINGTNIYSSNWTGPPSASFSIAGALASLDVLVVAIGPSPSQSGSNFTSSSASADPTSTFVSPNKSQKAALQIGLGVGLPVWAFLVLLAIWCFIRRRRRLSVSNLHQNTGSGIPHVGPPVPSANRDDTPDTTQLGYGNSQQTHHVASNSIDSNLLQPFRTPKNLIAQHHRAHTGQGRSEEAPPSYEEN